MEIIEQTNRTILFEEISPEKMDILTLIGDVRGKESLDDDKIKEINSYLLVGSFEEFLDRFEPTIYSFYNAVNQKVIYTLKKPEGIPDDCIQTIVLDPQNDVLKMMITMLNAKRATGVIEADFGFENILSLISPKKVMDDIRAQRKEIHFLYSKYEKLDEDSPERLDIADAMNTQFEIASKNYNNIMAMLPLAIEDSKSRLLIGQTGGENSGEKFIAGSLTMDENGELKIIERPTSESTALMITEEATNNALMEVFKNDYQEVNENPSEYVANLVVRTFCPLPVTGSTAIDVPKEVENYNHYLEFYQETKTSFIKTAKPLLEKLLGVYIYFNEYKTKNRSMSPKLLVCNSTLEMLTKSNNMPRLQVYLNTVNNKNNFVNTIWFGIVGNVEFSSDSNVKLTRERFKGNKKVAKTDLNSIETLTILLNGISDYKIQTFFSFETGEDTSFTALATKGIDEYLEKTRPLLRQEYSEYAIPCLPNIGVIPKNKSGVILDSLIIATEDGAKLSEDNKDLLKVWIEGVYIPACYAAAGIVSAYQCPEFLRERIKNVSRDFPGVRFDIESGDNALRVPTNLAKEISGYTNSIKTAINSRAFGFVFSSDNYQIDGKDLKQLTVYKARSLEVNDNEYEPLYKTLSATYIDRILRARTSDYKHDNVINFFSANPQSQRSVWIAKNGYANSILQPNDDIGYSINAEAGTCDVNISFGGNTKNLEIVLNKNAKAV